MKKIDCKKYAQEILDHVKSIPNKKALLILTAGDDPASEAYMKGKVKDGDACGVPVIVEKVLHQDDLMQKIRTANQIDHIGGIIVQLPLPAWFDAEEAIKSIAPAKDVDGFKPTSKFLPCTPEGILYILEREVGELEGKSVLLIGKGKLVGRPLIDLLLDRGCTLTVAHSKTRGLDFLLGSEYHDIVISATGKLRLSSLYFVSAGVVIDAGITRDEDGRLCGDFYGFDPYLFPDMCVTTVPGGVGLMTRAMLMKHMGEASA